ncbi:MAG: zinc-dependent metalloprotease [Pseudomonadota bacterium]
MKRLIWLILATAAVACSVETIEQASDLREPRVLAERPRTGAPLFRVEAEDDGKALITLPKPDADGVSLRVIHTAGLTAGLGSNPVGLDRGYSDSGRIIAFRRVGKKLVIEQENWTYRATTENALEKKAVRESFARSFLWAGEIADENAGGTYTADISGFLTGDILGLKSVMKEAGEGDYSIDAARSLVDASSVLMFPDNVEVDAFVTLAADKAGGQAAAASADGRAVTLTQHHSFVRLPDEGYRPRRFDPRAGGIDMPFYDFSAPLDQPIVTRYARRFRLERRDPSARLGPVKKPIVFYVDPGAPEPVRQALIEGASWWAEAFEAAGFEDAYRVEVLPEDAHPMDVRYNVIQWVHRQTRGWSYGGGVFDPRTGEMLKAHVVLGSQRIRQDRMIFEGLAGAEKSGTGGADDPVELSLARIRQLSAHEVGHTLGFAHNFAASSNNRASVMDYPAPYVRPTLSGGLDFSEAYGVGVGEWDKVAAHWLYSQYRDSADEAGAIEKIIRDAHAKGLRFVDDAQARGTESAHPYAAVWDNGEDAVKALEETMRVREIALSRFGVDAIKTGRPISDLKAVIAPIYLYHRYQIDAAAKLVGGYEFRYAVKGDGEAAGRPVEPARQRAALAALAATLDPAALDLPDATLDLFTPEIESFSGSPSGAELFSSDTAPMFDLLSAADAAATKTLAAILHPARAARLVETERRRADALTYEETLGALEDRLFWSPAEGRRAEIARRLETRFISMLIEVASGGAAGGDAQAATSFLSFGPGASASPEVRIRTNAYLKSLAGRLAPSPLDGFGANRTHREALRAMIAAHLERPAPAIVPAAKATSVPPGSPIGEDCWFCDLK